MPGALIYWGVAALFAAAAAALTWIHIGPVLAAFVALAIVMLGVRFVVAA
jgi:hypothetical protein